MQKSSILLRNVVKNSSQPRRLRMRNVAMTACLAGVVLFSGCGSGSGGGKSGLKSNEYLGKLPALHADYKLAKEADIEQIKKLKEAGKWSTNEKAAVKIDANAKARDEKLKADIEAELGKITGKDIPFTYSDGFKKTDFEVKSLKFGKLANLTGTYTAPISLVAKNDFVLNYKNSIDRIHYRVVAKDGSTIGKESAFATIPTKSYTKGDVLTSDGLSITLEIYANTEKWADFASIEFVTQEEYNKIEIND